MKHGLFLYLIFLLAIPARAQVDTTQHTIPGRNNAAAQLDKPYVILISADGFRYDYAAKYNTTNLLALAGNGVKAKYMLPAYPSLTFANHYAMVTGLTPAHNGIVGNNFYDATRRELYVSKNPKNTTDAKWYGGTPLWVLAEQQQMLSATFYWVGSDAGVKGVYPSYYYRYNEKIEISNRINTVVNWLKLPAEKRPHFITFYLPQVDQSGHKYGPDSQENEQAVRFIDSAVNALVNGVKTTGLDVNFVFVSDHGMVKTDNKNPIYLPAIIDTAKYLAYGDVPLVSLYVKEGAHVKADYEAMKAKAKGYDVYLKTRMPKQFGFGTEDDHYNRVGDIVLAARSPNVFQFGKYNINPGQHGYDVAQVPEMRAAFFAWGPAFQKNKTIAPFKNVSVYNLIARILGLTITEKVDGDDKLGDKILVNNK